MPLKNFNVRLLQESSISIMTPAGVKNVNMYDSCRSQGSPYMTPAGASMSVSMTPSGVKYFNERLPQESSISMHDSCRSQICIYV